MQALPPQGKKYGVKEPPGPSKMKPGRKDSGLTRQTPLHLHVPLPKPGETSAAPDSPEGIFLCLEGQLTFAVKQSQPIFCSQNRGRPATFPYCPESVHSSPS